MRRFAVFLFILIALFMSGCSAVEVSKAEESPKLNIIPTKKDLSQIDLSAIKHKSKGRAQDGSLEDENFKTLSIADDLMAHGKDSIPFLISKLDDETKMKRGVVDFWYQVYVGDVALIILNDFFTRNDRLTSTIPGFGWDNFLERGNDRDSMGEEILRNYVEKYGRKKKLKSVGKKFGTITSKTLFGMKPKDALS